MANEGTPTARECNAAELCRTCMNAVDDNKSRRKLVPIFSMVGDVFIANIITQCTAVEIYENDGLPAAICPDCFDTVKLVDAFAKAARNSDAELRQLFKPDSTLKEPDPSDNAGFVEVVEEEVLEEEVLEEIPIEAGTAVTHFLEIKFENSEQMFDETGEEPIELSDDSDSDCIEIDEEEEEPPEELDRLEPGPPRKRSRNPQPRRRKRPIQTEEDLQLSEKEQELFTVIEIPSESHLCCGCLLYFESAEELEAHRLVKHIWKCEYLRKPTSKHTCEGCLRLFGTTRGMQYHKTRISMLKVVWECKKCKIMFKLPGKRREHAKLHTDGDPVALVVRVKATTKQALGWVCCGPICSQSFSTEEELIAHGRTSHWIDRKAADLEHADRPEQCQVCFQRFLDRKQIFAHQRRKYKIKKIKCTLCGQAVSSKTELKRHEVKVHNVDGFKCEICGKSYPSASSLTSHIKLMHVKGAQHMCTICGKTFRQSGGLSIHMSCHVEVPQFKCEICLKMFKHKLHLRYHMRTHTGEKPYKCRYCDSAFANHTNWRRHEMTHTGDKPHNCSYCEKSFILRRSLLEHEASHTGGPKPIRKARSRQTKAQPKGGQVDENMRVVEVDDEYFSSSSSDSTADNLQQQQQQNAAVASIADQPQTVQSAVYAMYNVVPTASGYVVK
nr:zinc finger protein 436 isoform X2 [Aedes albopictus]